ncbi:SLAM family member 5-like [Engystomops pustulosus]|uniref:SLAM family member 5-like n=1 Tax=Engystomops pustulosus TaxID=76066 RepID=UPI003AFB727D
MLGRIIETLSILLAAKLLISKGQRRVPLPVYGVINQSVVLRLPVDQTGSGLEMYWTFQGIILALFTNNQQKIMNKKFMTRLETSDSGTTLRIHNLSMEDAGIYAVSVHTTGRNIYQTSYNLTVYEPVPSPDIQREVTGYRTDGCNVTLQCSVPSHPSHLSYTWKYRDQDQEYQPYDSGSTTQISLAPDHQDLEILCIVHNPADHKNVSRNMSQICPKPDITHKCTGGKRSCAFFLVGIILCSRKDQILEFSYFL